jgi:hypothetical protein
VVPLTRYSTILTVTLLAWSPGAQAQAEAPESPRQVADTVIPDRDDEGAWSFAALAYGYVVPEDEDFLMPLVYADRGKLHFEARYNYEAPETGSLWAGYRLGAEGRVSFEAIPMLGGVVGDVSGVAPGFEVTLGFEKFELYSEGELFFDFEEEAGDFFYSWTELYYMPTDRFRFGLVGQRTRAYQTEVEVNRGLLAGAAKEPFDVSVYVLNLGWDDPTWVVAASVNF